KTLHEAFKVATTGRPGPVLVDIPKDIQFAKFKYSKPKKKNSVNGKFHNKYSQSEIDELINLISKAKKPVIYTGGGVINSGPKASELLRELVSATGFPITSTLQGLGAFPADDNQFVGMLGMHGTYEANMSMHQSDLMICVGARFDDRITGKVSGFSPKSKKIHLDIDASSFNKSVNVDLTVQGDLAVILKLIYNYLKENKVNFSGEKIKGWWKKINKWRSRNCLSYKNSKKLIKPQYAIQRLDLLTKKFNPFITTEVGQHQMWAAQFLTFNKPKHWMTSGGLGTMGYGLPAAMGVQVAHPKGLVIDVAGEASILMNIQEMSTIKQYRLPVKVFILNNHYMGMVRQWQELLHGNRLSESYMDSLPDFVKLAESFGAVGLRANKPSEVDDLITEMIRVKGPVICDVQVDPTENCFPMIPSGSTHNQMLLGPNDKIDGEISEEGMVLV
ncbi:MAG: acetolactate synthase 3 large subunit, partial [Rickettsiales bacterium]|nr:acetolactate synthase 3 large subunit [Rickettsiales bacterium]